MTKQFDYFIADIKRFFPGGMKVDVKFIIRMFLEQRLYAILLYRYGRWVYFQAKGGVFLIPLKILYILLNKIFLELLLGMSIPVDCDIGPGLYINNFQGLVINPNVTIGQKCSLGHGVIIGTAADGSYGAPKVGDNVFIGSRAIVMGAITIGDNSRIGANSVVNRDVPPNVTVVGVPARIVRYHNQ